jgi:hypothetical protein
MTRDPRKDPKAGDVLRVQSGADVDPYIFVVTHTDPQFAYFTRVSASTGSTPYSDAKPRATWAAWMEGADVLWPLPDHRISRAELEPMIKAARKLRDKIAAASAGGET